MWANERNLHIISASLGFQFRRYALGGLHDCAQDLTAEKHRTAYFRTMDLQDLVSSLFELTSEPPGRAADLKQFDTRDFDQI